MGTKAHKIMNTLSRLDGDLDAAGFRWTVKETWKIETGGAWRWLQLREVEGIPFVILSADDGSIDILTPHHSMFVEDIVNDATVRLAKAFGAPLAKQEPEA